MHSVPVACYESTSTAGPFHLLASQVSVEERRGIPHHLIDVLEPHEEFSAGDFYDLARPVTDAILQAPPQVFACIMQPATSCEHSQDSAAPQRAALRCWVRRHATGRQPRRCAYTPFEQQPLQPTAKFNSRVDAYGQACAGQRGRVPIVVGGTGFYLRWYVHGKPSTPRSTKESAALAEQALERVNNLSSGQTKS